MIKFETKIGKFSMGMEKVQSNNNLFFNITNNAYVADIKSILQQGVHYGYIRMLIDGNDAFESYHVQIVQAQWLAYIEILEQFLQNGYVHIEVPILIEIKRIDHVTLSFKAEKSVFVFSYMEFIEQLIGAASEYFEMHRHVTNDNIYEDIIAYLKQIHLTICITE